MDSRNNQIRKIPMVHRFCLSALAISILALLAISEAPSQTNFWQQMNNGLTNLNVRALAADSGGTMYAATDSNLVFRSTNNGDSWTHTSPTNAVSIGYLETNSLGHVFAGDGFAGVYRSTDSGNNWVQVDSGLSNPFVRALAVSASGDIFVGCLAVGGADTNCAYRSTNNGNAWTAVTTGLNDSIGISSLAISPSGNIFAGSYFRGMYRSTNNGNSWVGINTGLPPGIFLPSISISPNGHAFVGTQDSGIYRSTDDGNTWGHTNTGLPVNTIVWSLAIKPGGDIFAAVSQSTFSYGILRSTDDGGTWALINSGMTTNATVYDLVFNRTGYIFATTYGAGVFRSVAPVTIVEQTEGDIPLLFSLEQNYPNPFNPTTQIKFRSPTTGDASLKVYDLLGREVATLVNEQMNPGTYSATWNAAGFASGVYLYRMRAGTFIETKKLLLLR
jgi:photosystem II stability/assembly factor-like uncharacterized protein